MQIANYNAMLQESLKRLLPLCPELPGEIKLLLDSMEVNGHLEDLLKEETNCKALVNFHLLELVAARMRYYDQFKQPLSLLSFY